MLCHGWGSGRISKLPTSWKIILETVTGNAVISDIDAFMYVVLNKTEKCAFWGIGYGWMYNAIDDVLHTPRYL